MFVQSSSKNTTIEIKVVARDMKCLLEMGKLHYVMCGWNQCAGLYFFRNLIGAHPQPISHNFSVILNNKHPAALVPTTLYHNSTLPLFPDAKYRGTLMQSGHRIEKVFPNHHTE